MELKRTPGNSSMPTGEEGKTKEPIRIACVAASRAMGSLKSAKGALKRAEPVLNVGARHLQYLAGRALSPRGGLAVPNSTAASWAELTGGAQCAETAFWPSALSTGEAPSRQSPPSFAAAPREAPLCVHPPEHIFLFPMAGSRRGRAQGLSPLFSGACSPGAEPIPSAREAQLSHGKYLLEPPTAWSFP